MKLKELSNTEHSQLLQQLQNVPYEQSREFAKQLNIFFLQYNQLLNEMATIIEKYRSTVAKINERQPLIKRKEA